MKRIIIAIVFVFSACAQLGVIAPTGFDENIAYAYGTVASVRQSAADALTAGTIKVTDAEQVQTVADEARAALDAAQSASFQGDPTTAAGKLQLATGLLTQLQAYLTSTQRK